MEMLTVFEVNLKRNLKSRSIVSPYVYMIKTMYDFGSALLICPIRLKYEETEKMYRVRKCHALQQFGCITVQILSIASAFNMLNGMWTHLLKNKTHIVAYFDFMNGIFLHVYFYTLVYFHWMKFDRIQVFIHNLQTSPLAQLCTSRQWKVRLFAAFFWCLTLYMAYIWLIVIFGFDYKQWRTTTVAMAQQIFLMTSDNLFLSFAALIGRFYHGFFIHLAHNVFGPVYLFAVYFVAKDFSSAILVEPLTVYKIRRLYKEYVKFLQCSNMILSSFCIHFVGMTMTYHSLHLFDALNTQNLLWKINTYLYIGYLINFLAITAHILLLGKKMKKWLWHQQNYIQMRQEELTLLLCDLSNETNLLAIRGGAMFKMSPRFSGLIIQYLCSYSMLNTLAQKHT